MRKIWLIVVMMLIPGCLDSTPESLDGVEISILAESLLKAIQSNLWLPVIILVVLNFCGILEIV